MATDGGCCLFSLIDNWSRFLLLVIYSWCGSEKSSPIKPYQTHVCCLYGSYWAHLSLHRLDCPCHGHGYFGRAACHAQFPGSEAPRAGRDMQVLHVLLLRYCTSCISFNYIYIHIYIYISCSTLVRKCSEFQELPLKDPSDLGFAMRFCDQGCDQVAFVEFDCMTFGDLREFDTFFCGWFADNSWRIGISNFENTPAFHAEALYAATFESHGPWVLYECLGVSVRWGVLIIFDIVLRVPSMPS